MQLHEVFNLLLAFWTSSTYLRDWSRLSLENQSKVCKSLKTWSCDVRYLGLHAGSDLSEHTTDEAMTSYTWNKGLHAGSDLSEHTRDESVTSDTWKKGLHAGSDLSEHTTDEAVTSDTWNKGLYTGSDPFQNTLKKFSTGYSTVRTYR